jgi:hypothetical protein
MPYVRKQDRDINLYTAVTPGVLNYHITGLIDAYIERQGLGYGSINEVIGVLECAKLELYRRIAAPYEDKKKEENGDVYTV